MSTFIDQKTTLPMVINQKTALLISLSVLVLQYSCKNPAPRQEALVRIPISEEDLRLPDSLSKHMRIEKLIRLENHPDALMGMITRIEYIDNLIFILKQDQSEELLVFSAEGKFLRKLCNKGQGPGEALFLQSFFVDSIRKQVYLVDQGNKVIIKDYEGRLVSEFKCPRGAVAMIRLDEERLIFAGPAEYQISLTDNKGKVYRRFVKFDPNFAMGHSFPMIKTTDGVLIYQNIDDTIYRIKNDTIKPAYLVDFGENALTRKQILELPANSMGGRDINPNFMYAVVPNGNAGNTISFQFEYRQKAFMVFTDPGTLKKCIFETREIRKDPKVGKGFFSSVSSNHTWFIGYYLPGFMEMNQIPPALASLGPVSPEDNPILVLYRFEFGRGDK